MYNRKYLSRQCLNEKEGASEDHGPKALLRPLLSASGSFFLCWLYVTFYAPRHIEAAGIVESAESVRMLSQHAFYFGAVLLLLLLPGLLMRSFGRPYFRCLTLGSLFVTACLSWNLAKPSEHLAAAINNFLNAPYRRYEPKMRQEKESPPYQQYSFRSGTMSIV